MSGNLLITIPSRSSNIERARWRNKCREKLSEHISKTSLCGFSNFELIVKDINLKLSIDPAQVRLKTTTEDQYRWKILPGKEHLFQKQMSKHSIGAYMELFREVGKSFEAVPSTVDKTKTNQGIETKDTFSGKIEQLEKEKSLMTEELGRWKLRADHAEKDLDELKSTVNLLK